MIKMEKQPEHSEYRRGIREIQQAGKKWNRL